MMRVVVSVAVIMRVTMGVRMDVTVANRMFVIVMVMVLMMPIPLGLDPFP